MAVSSASCLLSAQGYIGWLQYPTTFAPSARSASAMVHDWARNRIVMFGGLSSVAPVCCPLADTWEWDGTAWTLRQPTSVPEPRWGAGVAYDSMRERTVLFGGSDTTSVLATTWEWDGADWTQRAPVVSPPARTLFGMAYDATRGETVIFGGFDGTNYLDDTWVWDGTAWTQRVVAVRPAARKQAAMVHDAAAGLTVLFGGEQGGAQQFGDTWIWDGSQWTPRTPSLSPDATWASAAAFDPVRGRVVVAGGYTASGLVDEVWEWDGIVWHRHGTVQSPPARQNASLAFWPGGEGVMFGGLGMSGMLLADTWGYRGAYPAYFATSGHGCAGTFGVPHLDRHPTFAWLPWIGTTFGLRVTNALVSPPPIVALGFAPAAVDLGFLGMPACILLTSFDILVPATANGSTAQLLLTFPAASAMLGTRFYAQALAFDAGINPFGATVSNAVEAIVGSR